MTDAQTERSSGTTRVEGSGRAAKILYRPFGIVGSIVGGFVAGQVFKQVYKRVTRGDDADAPTPLQSEYSLRQIVLAAVLQGAIFAAVKALIDRGGARAFERWTGEWPGD